MSNRLVGRQLRAAQGCRFLKELPRAHDFSIEHPSWTGGYGFWEPFRWECAKCGVFTGAPEVEMGCSG